MTLKLFFSAIAKFLIGLALVGLLIFLPAGTFAFMQGWILIGILFFFFFCEGLVMKAEIPELLSMWGYAKEKQGE